MSANFKYTREEKLKSKTRILEVYEKGVSGFTHPFKFYSLAPEDEANSNSPILRVCFSVPKKKFKHAVDRNRVKRLCRECFRLNKSMFYDSNPTVGLDVYFIFVGKSLPDYKEVEKGMKNALKILSSQNQSS